VIEEPDLEHVQGFVDLLGRVDVCLGRFRVAAGVVVQEDGGGGIEEEGFPDDIPGFD